MLKIKKYPKIIVDKIKNGVIFLYYLS